MKIASISCASDSMRKCAWPDDATAAARVKE